MSTNSISAGANPGLANDLVKKATAEQKQAVQPAEITPPSDTLVHLPGGFINEAGEVIKTAEVRELTGRDEEAIAKTNTIGKALSLIVNRATVSIDGKRVTDELLDGLLAGDRDALLLGIYKATFGDKARIESYCGTCMAEKTVEVDLNTDIKTKALADPIAGRTFTVHGKHEFVVTLPNGAVQKEIINSIDKTAAELATLLLEKTVQEIDGNPVFSKAQIQGLGISDRRLIGEELSNRAIGPQLENITVQCPDCEGEVEVPINFGTLFRL